ncbi:MAG: hypothetical protein K0R82_632 [Flavipsychrobacter sp.]|jgi:hypothetical protein|nr:hypothetical protein [Flavipsychrobacter sp.]
MDLSDNKTEKARKKRAQVSSIDLKVRPCTPHQILRLRFIAREAFYPSDDSLI